MSSENQRTYPHSIIRSMNLKSSSDLYDTVLNVCVNDCRWGFDPMFLDNYETKIVMLHHLKIGRHVLNSSTYFEYVLDDNDSSHLVRRHPSKRCNVIFGNSGNAQLYCHQSRRIIDQKDVNFLRYKVYWISSWCYNRVFLLRCILEHPVRWRNDS